MTDECTVVELRYPVDIAVYPNCRKCGKQRDDDFYALCVDCRVQILTKQARDRRRALQDEYDQAAAATRSVSDSVHAWMSRNKPWTDPTAAELTELADLLAAYTTGVRNMADAAARLEACKFELKRLTEKRGLCAGCWEATFDLTPGERRCLQPRDCVGTR